MESKFCVICITEKCFDIFYNKYREVTECIFKRSSKRYYEKQDKFSNQGILFYEKIELCYLQSLN